MTIRELFLEEKLDKDWLTVNLTGVSSYYDSCYNFLMENWEKEIDDMSAKQGAWLTKILDDCVERRIQDK